MYEYHGWATLRATWENNDDTEGHLHDIVAELNAYLGQIQWPYVLSMAPVNGEYHVWMSGNPNRKSTCPEHDPVELFRHIGKVAPGSYGLLHVWDKNDIGGFSNAFRVYVLARGEVQERLDSFLSPCVPVLEDPST